MKTTEEQAYSHVDKIFSEIIDKYQSAPWNEFRDALARIYLAGATEALSGQWRKPEDEFPEMRQRVLLCFKERDCNRAMIGILKRIPYASNNPDNPNWEWNLGVRKEDVIAWMPLPEPPIDESV